MSNTLTLDQKYKPVVADKINDEFFYYNLFFKHISETITDQRTGQVTDVKFDFLPMNQNTVILLRDCFSSLNIYNQVCNDFRSIMYENYEYRNGTMCKLQADLTVAIPGGIRPVTQTVHVRTIYRIIRNKRLMNIYKENFMIPNDLYEDNEEQPEVDHGPPGSIGIYNKWKKIPMTVFDPNNPELRLYTADFLDKSMQNSLETLGEHLTEMLPVTTFQSRDEALAALDVEEKHFINSNGRLMGLTFNCPQHGVYASFEYIFKEGLPRYRLP
jgi:hypothetical protein